MLRAVPRPLALLLAASAILTVAWAFTTGNIYLKSDGTPWRPIVHIEDISRAFIAALEAPANDVWNEAFNVGQTDHNYRIRDLAEIVAEVEAGLLLEMGLEVEPVAHFLPCVVQHENDRHGLA